MVNYNEYVSEYKNDPNGEGSLAIDNMLSSDLWKIIPEHCRNIDDNLPEFQNKELKKHLKNYVGQMCDMYLTQSDENNVAIKNTLDEIRREVLYLNENQDKLNESDKKKLKEYLDGLD
ncbi:MAG: hypothetical protein LBE36_04130 [Flavobacteriaceae bacterium]|nr:hypothetical protein [Flavobacteriaceae bacterium]